MDAIKVLLDRYGLKDPALAPGKFSNASLQALYNQLVAQGMGSVSEALKVGATIEQVDIKDLQTRIAQTDNLDVRQVFNNLLSGSYNHLNAFSGNQMGLGQGIISGGTANGNGYGRGPRP
jgi:hypothetical protein